MNRPPSTLELARQRNRRVMVYSLSLSICFGTLAIVLTDQMLNEQVAIARSQKPPPLPTETVVVAAVDVPFGAKLSAGMLREIEWPRGTSPKGVYRAIGEVMPDGTQPIARDRFVAGEPILADKLNARHRRATLAAALGPGMKAISIKVDEVIGVSGFVLPGDLVDILLTRGDRDRGDDEASREPFTATVMQRVRVLAVDQTRSSDDDGPKPARTITVEASLENAQRLTLASKVGTLNLVLRDPLKSREVQEVERITLAQLTNEPSTADAKPKAPTGLQTQPNLTASVPSGRSNTTTISVIRQVAKTDYQVTKRTR